VRLLVTRPEPDGERTAATLRARGHEVLVAALMQIEAAPDADLGAGPWGGVILTSANAVRAIERHVRRAELWTFPVFAVGRRTAEAAHAAGFARITSADGDARDLVRLILAGDRAPLLYLAGEDRAADIPGELAAHGVRVETAVVYRAVEAQALAPAAAAALRAASLDGVLHFSQRTAAIYLDCARRAGLLVRALAPSHYCLSEQVAEPLKAAGAARIAIAARPEEAALIALVPSS
jgi:uroporphyrinogen-III synthase